jgi:hypothetical protein
MKELEGSDNISRSRCKSRQKSLISMSKVKEKREFFKLFRSL